MVVEILENLKRAVAEYDADGAASFARKAVEDGIDPLRALDALTEGIRQVGDGYGRGELWLPDLVGGADAMMSAMPVLEEAIRRTGAKPKTLGTIVIGTVYGDIHNIGKAMVAVLSIAEGFKVIDLGVNVKAEEFLEAVEEHTADILAMSALLTTTAPEQRKVIKGLKEAGIREKVKIVVGGAAITREFAEAIGADGYETTALKAVGLFKELVAKGG